MLARENGGGQRVLGSLQSPHTHCTLSIAKFPFRLPEQTSHLPNKTKRGFLIMEKIPQNPPLPFSLSPLPHVEECAPRGEATHADPLPIGSAADVVPRPFSTVTYRKEE